MFDQLLLLQKVNTVGPEPGSKRGGKMVYFGSVRARARELVRYFVNIPGTPPMPERVNPADWMLTVSTSRERLWSVVVP